MYNDFIVKVPTTSQVSNSMMQKRSDSWNDNDTLNDGATTKNSATMGRNQYNPLVPLEDNLPIRPKPLPLKRSCQKCLIRPRVLWFVKEHSCFFCIECYNSAFNLSTTYRSLTGAPCEKSIDNSPKPIIQDQQAMATRVPFPPPLVFCACCGLDDCDVWHEKNGENVCDTCHDLGLKQSSTTSTAITSTSFTTRDTIGISHFFNNDSLQIAPDEHHHDLSQPPTKKLKKPKKICNLCNGHTASRWLNDRDAEGVVCQKCYLRRYRGAKIIPAIRRTTTPTIANTPPPPPTQHSNLPKYYIRKPCSDCEAEVHLPSASWNESTLVLCQSCHTNRNVAIGFTDPNSSTVEVGGESWNWEASNGVEDKENSSQSIPSQYPKRVATTLHQTAPTSQTVTASIPVNANVPLKKKSSAKQGKASKIQRYCTRCEVQDSIAWYRDPKQPDGHHCRRCYLEMKKKRQ